MEEKAKRFSVVQGGKNNAEDGISERKEVVVVSDIVHFDVKAMLGDVYQDVSVDSVNSSLPFKAAGEVIVTTLNDSEKLIFSQMNNLNKLIEGMSKDTVGSVIMEMGRAIKEGQEREFSKKTSEYVENMFDEKDKVSHFKRQQALDMLKSMLFWHLKNKHNLHGWMIGIRRNFELVKVSKMKMSPKVMASGLSNVDLSGEE